MPLSVFNTTGGLDTLCQDEPTAAAGFNPSVIRVLALNDLLNDNTLFPTLTGRPNPGSIRGDSAPGNLVSPHRTERLIFQGQFIITAETNKGYELAPNYNLRVTKGSTVNLDCRYPAATTTFWQDPYRLAAYIQALLQASGLTGASSFVVSFSGRRSSSPTYKWTISANAAFTLTADANSILLSLGFTGSSYSGSSSYTGERVAIHTEEYFVVDRGGTYDIGEASWNRFRWLYFVDLNMEGPSGTSPKSDHKLEFFLGNSLAAAAGQLANTDASGYVADQTYFNLENLDSSTYHCYTDLGGLLTRSSGLTRSRLLAIDLQKWASDHGSIALNHRYIGVRICNPTHPSGRIEIGYMGVGADWWPRHNIAWGTPMGPTLRTQRTRTDLGADLASYRSPGRRLEGAWTSGAPLMADDVHFLDQLYRARRLSSSIVEGQGNDRNLQVADRPVLLIDPSVKSPYADETTFANSRAMFFGQLEIGSPVPIGNGYHTGTLAIEEAVI